jgi:hypothetical protein
MVPILLLGACGETATSSEASEGSPATSDGAVSDGAASPPPRSQTDGQPPSQLDAPDESSPSGVTWLSGCYGNEGKYSLFLGHPPSIVGFGYNNNTSVDNRTNITLDPKWSPAAEYTVIESTYSLIDRSRGDTWATGTSGALDAVWRQGMQRVHDSWGTRKWLFIRPAHEFNGQDLYYVGPGDEADFKATWVRFYAIVQAELVAKGKAAFVTFNPNAEKWGKAVELSDALYPGDAYVDVIGVDYYDNARHNDEASWDAQVRATTPSGNPHGLLTWQAYARSHGKPLAVPEWGLETDMTTLNDNPFFVEKMNEFFHANAGSGSGQVLYANYFEAWDNSWLHPPTQVPNASAMYKSLSWGDGSGLLWPLH